MPAKKKQKLREKVVELEKEVNAVKALLQEANRQIAFMAEYITASDALFYN